MPASKKEYLANCLWHIRQAECHISKERERDEDIAGALLVAAESGVDHAHAYLRELIKQAEEGKYL